jgi:hypothetical protein
MTIKTYAFVRWRTCDEARSCRLLNSVSSDDQDLQSYELSGLIHDLEVALTVGSAAVKTNITAVVISVQTVALNRDAKGRGRRAHLTLGSRSDDLSGDVVNIDARSLTPATADASADGCLWITTLQDDVNHSATITINASAPSAVVAALRHGKHRAAFPATAYGQVLLPEHPVVLGELFPLLLRELA